MSRSVSPLPGFESQIITNFCGISRFGFRVFVPLSYRGGGPNGAGGLQVGGTQRAQEQAREGTDGFSGPDSRGKGSDYDASKEKLGRPHGSEHAESVNGGGRGGVQTVPQGTGKEAGTRHGSSVTDSGAAGGGCGTQAAGGGGERLRGGGGGALRCATLQGAWTGTSQHSTRQC